MRSTLIAKSADIDCRLKSRNDSVFRPVAQVILALIAPEFIVSLIFTLADVETGRQAHAAAADDGG